MDPIVGGALVGLGGSVAQSGLQGLWGLIGRKKQMQREDNAVQRRAKDMEAAGLSKTLAAGSPAQASASLGQSPDFDLGKDLSKVPIQRFEREMQKAQIDLVEEQARNARNIADQSGFQANWLSMPIFSTGTLGNWENYKVPEGHTLTNGDLVGRSMVAENQNRIITNEFFNKYGLPNQPGVLNSQTGSALVLSEAFHNMNPQEKVDFLKAWGAQTLADVAGKFLGATAGSLGSTVPSLVK